MKVILIVDASVNFILGTLLLFFSPAIVNFLGVPPSSTSFYANILGAIFIGITIALVIGATSNRTDSTAGLGLLGAISINVCGGITLAIWLIVGKLSIPTKGFVFLWTLVAILVGVSLLELLHSLRANISR